MKKEILILFSIPFIFVWSCSKHVSHLPRPQKGIYTKTGFGGYGDIVSIDPNDAVTINKYSLTETFTITNIIEEKGVYSIIIKSDSIRASVNPFTNKNEKDSFYVHYQIVSLKSKKIKGYEEIKKGQQYELTLIPCILSKPNAIPSMRYVRAYTKGKYCHVSMSMFDIYTTPNLEGLYYIPAGGTVPDGAKKEEIEK